MTEHLRVVERSPASVCVYCHDAIREREQTWCCERCGTTQHLGCAREHGRCSVFSCENDFSAEEEARREPPLELALVCARFRESLALPLAGCICIASSLWDLVRLVLPGALAGIWIPSLLWRSVSRVPPRAFAILLYTGGLVLIAWSFVRPLMPHGCH